MQTHGAGVPPTKRVEAGDSGSALVLAAPFAEAPPGSSSNSTPSVAQFKELYDTHFRMVWRALSRLGASDADLMDLTQKVFLTAHRRIHLFEGRSALSTWLWGICRCVAIAYRRSGVVRHEVATDPSGLPALGERPENGEGCNVEVETMRRLQVERILAKLTDEQRMVFLLFELDELNGPEIAALLDIPLGTVRSRLRCARALFRRETRRLALTAAFTDKANTAASKI
jgi:RNA polymerase sigma-70 factor (ECF subfamily)